MRRLAEDIGCWPEMLSPQAFKATLINLNLQCASRKEYTAARFVGEASALLGLQGLGGAIEKLRASDDNWLAIRAQLKTAKNGDTKEALRSAGALVAGIADLLEAAYRALDRTVNG